MLPSILKATLILSCMAALRLDAAAVDSGGAIEAARAQLHGEPHFDITWVGGPTMLVRFGSFTLMSDPTLGESFAMGDPNDPQDHEKVRDHRRLTPTPQIDLRAVDLLVLSHIHPDHFDTQAVNMLDRPVRVISPVQDAAEVRTRGYEHVDGLAWGETREFDSDRGRVRITAMPARHSRDPAIATKLGTGNGYWIEFRQGDWHGSLYWTGDSMPTDDVIRAVKSLGEPDVLVPHVGGVGPTGPLGQISMQARDVVELAAAVHPKYVLPIHHSTYDFYREPISELARQSVGKPFRLDLIEAGTTRSYDYPAPTRRERYPLEN